MKRVRHAGMAAVGSLLFLSSPAVAGDAVFTLGEVVAKDSKETITQVGTVEEIDRKTIDLTDTRTVADAIKTLPGVNFAINTRNEKIINVRGFDMRQVPILYDGIPMSVPYDGFVDAGKLPTRNLSQITVTKGISSVLYGPNTMGGVINLVSLKPTRILEGDGEFTVDETGATAADVNLGTRFDRFYLTVSGGYLESDGFLLSDDFDPTPLQGKGTRSNSDEIQTSVSTKLGFTPAAGHEYAFGFNRVNYTKGLPPNVTDSAANARYWRFSDWDKATYYLLGDSTITDGLTMKTRLYYDTYYNVLDSYDNATYSTQTTKKAFHSTYDDYSYGATLNLSTTAVPYNRIGFAFTYKDDIHREQGTATAPWGRYEAETFTYGLEDSIRINDRLSLVLGVSHDVQNPVFANNSPLRGEASTWNPQGGILYAPTDTVRLHASVGRKTRFPSLKELYSEAIGNNIANPTLGAEKAINYEIGVEADLGTTSSAGLNLFYADISDLIQNMPTTVVIPGSTPVKYYNQYQNINKATYKGVELSLKSQLIEDNDFTFSYTYLDARNESPERTSDNLTDRPEHKVYLSDHYTANRWLALFAALDWSSDRYDSNMYNVADFFTITAKVIGTVSKNVAIECGVRNLTDANNELIHGLPTEGRTLFANLKGSF